MKSGVVPRFGEGRDILKSAVAWASDYRGRRIASVKMPRRRPGVVAGVVLWVPLLMAVQAGIYGGLVPSQVSGRFPIFRIATFNIRSEELLILSVFALWCCSRVFSLPFARGVSRPSRSVVGLSVLALIGLLYSAFRGIRAGNTESLMESRALAVPLLYLAMALSSIPKIKLTRFARRVRLVFSVAATILALTVLVPLGRFLELALAELGGIYGGLSTALEPMIVFVCCLLWARILMTDKARPFEVTLLLLLITCLVLKIGKTNWVYVVEVPALFFVVLGQDPWRRRRRPRTRLLLVFVLAVVLLLALVGWIRAADPEAFELFVTESRDRITRPDADGDWSGGRFDMNRAGLKKMREAPLFGQGMGFWYEFHLNGIPVAKMPDHFAPLWLIIRAGLFTAIPVALLAIWYIRKGYRAVKNVRNIELQQFVVGCYVYTLTIFIYSLYGVPQGLFEPMILFWLAVAVVVKSDKHLENVGPKSVDP